MNPSAMSLAKRFHRAAGQLFLSCLALSTACTAPAFAVQPGSYDVEIIIFTHRHAGSDGEQWPVRLPEQTLATGFLNSERIIKLPVDAYRLNGISNGLRQSSAYSVVFHRAWRQPVYGSTNAVGYPVHAVAENGSINIEGSVRLIRERFLHLDADLVLVPAGSSNAVTGADSLQTSPVFELSEKRRIKSNTVHYFDHPRFGMIAMVTPHYSPEEVQQISEENTEETAAEEKPVTVPVPDDDQLTR
jgi:hypothetical protein